MKHPAPCRHGFTLLEVLLASLLMAVLVAALWNLLSTYLRLFETGHAKTEQSQLARTLLRQIEADLHAALPPNTGDRSPRRRSASAPLARGAVSLRGTYDRLEIVVVEAVGASSLETAAAEVGDDAAPPVDPPRIPELRKIVYSFAPHLEGAPRDRQAPPGLLRREFGWETSNASGLDARGFRAATRETDGQDVSSVGELRSIVDLASDGAGAAGWHERHSTAPPDDTTLYAPEVVGLSLRYFDGGAWTDDWDSRARGSLPVAVEMTLEVRAFDRQQSARVAPRPRTGRESRRLDDPRRPVYRLVAYLPAAQAGRSVERGVAARKAIGMLP